MPAKRHSKESIVSTLQNLATNLGRRTLTQRDVQTVLPSTSVRSYFGSLRKAVETAGLEMIQNIDQLNSVRRILSDDELFGSIHAVEQRLGHEPAANDYLAEGEYSPKPFKRRFGAKWSDTLAHYRKWKTEIGAARVRSAPMPEVTEIEAGSEPPLPTMKAIVRPQQVPATAPIQFYGEPFDFRGLRHAPINEQGVVYLFGMVSRELGFYVESVQQGFPDCEAKYLHDAKKNLWARARIEFEFKASSFREHGHDASKCDLIICWINDWPDCPLRVIELREEIRKLPSR